MASNTISPLAPTFPSPSAGDDFTLQAGRYDVTANVDATAVNQMLFARIMRGYKGTIGTATGPWAASFSQARGASAGPALEYLADEGHFYWRSKSLDSSTTPVALIDGGGHLHLITEGTVSAVELNRGEFSLENGPTVTNLFVRQGTAWLRDTGTGTALTAASLLHALARVRCARPVTTLNIYNGEFWWLADSANGANAITTINMFGGKLIVVSPGTLTDILHYGGAIDTSQLDRPWTITNTAGTGSFVNPNEPGVQAFLDHPLITFTNAMNKDNYRMGMAA